MIQLCGCHKSENENENINKKNGEENAINEIEKSGSQ